MSYDYWSRALVDPKALNAREFKITAEPQCGFYRTHDLKPVAIWEDGGEVFMIVADGDIVGLEEQERVWVSCAKRPISEEWYRAVEDGFPWPDLDRALAEMGDNVRAGMDEIEQIELLAKQAEEYREIEDDDAASRALSLRNRLNELRGIVDKKREAMKAPHLKAARDIDENWMPPVKLADRWAKVLKALAEAWETKKRQRLRAEQEALMRARQEAEAANAPPPPERPRAPEPKEQIRSGHGRAASVRGRMVAVEVNDQQVAWENFGMRAEVQAALIKCAQSALDAGADTVPGFEVEERAVIR